MTTPHRPPPSGHLVFGAALPAWCALEHYLPPPGGIPTVAVAWIGVVLATGLLLSCLITILSMRVSVATR